MYFNIYEATHSLILSVPLYSFPHEPIYLIPFICMVDVFSLNFCRLLFTRLVSFRLVSSHHSCFSLTWQRNGVDDSHRCCMRCWQTLDEIQTHLHEMRYADEEIGCDRGKTHRNGPSYSFTISPCADAFAKLFLQPYKIYTHSTQHTSHSFACTIEIFVKCFNFL